MKDIDLKQKCILSLVLVIVMGFVLYYTYEDTPENQYQGIIRLHVIANSDSKEDQELKLKVRDEIIKEVSSLEGSKTIENSRNFLKNHLTKMEQTADRVIKENGMTYSSSADMGVKWIPEKTYGDAHFPAGNYEALNVTLGKGEGENWWCVLFPPLCLIDEDPEAIEELDLTESEQLELKSKVKEIIEKNKKSDGI